ncbi:MAG TPA: hypothetical protein DDW86_08575, partial [Clostridiales bacterium]|nr:hypothetical protein [Clostridiales bacterium]
MALLEQINDPGDLKALSPEQLILLAKEIRQFVLEHVATTG